MSTTLQPGDRIRYTRRFLRNVGSTDADTARRLGTIIKVEPELRRNGPCPIVLRWDGSDDTKRVLSCNLEPRP
jgi:hypothetical protein